MTTTYLNERIFEEHIAACLSASELYNRCQSNDFDIGRHCDMEMPEHFLRLQLAVWNVKFLFPRKENGYGGRIITALEINDY
jgi:hypothetical protein